MSWIFQTKDPWGQTWKSHPSVLKQLWEMTDHHLSKKKYWKSCSLWIMLIIAQKSQGVENVHNIFQSIGKIWFLHTTIPFSWRLFKEFPYKLILKWWTLNIYLFHIRLLNFLLNNLPFKLTFILQKVLPILLEAWHSTTDGIVTTYVTVVL